MSDVLPEVALDRDDPDVVAVAHMIWQWRRDDDDLEIDLALEIVSYLRKAKVGMNKMQLLAKYRAEGMIEVKTS